MVEFLSGVQAFKRILGVTVLCLVAFANTANAQNAASFKRIDSATQGNWKTVYGSQGYSISGANPNNADVTSLPSYVSSYSLQNATYHPSFSQSDWGSISLQPIVSNQPRIASGWGSDGTINNTEQQYPRLSFDINFTDKAVHQVAFYCFDCWGDDVYGGSTAYGINEKIEAIDAYSGAVLATATTGDIRAGKYIVFNAVGHVKFKVTSLVYWASFVNAVFFDNPNAANANTASFMRTDSSTRGDWKESYGGQGFVVSGGGQSNNDSQILPAYVGTYSANQTYHPSLPPDNFPDASLDPVTNGQPRIVSGWGTDGSDYNSPTQYPRLTEDISFSDSIVHQVSFYCFDFWTLGYPNDYPNGITEKIEAVDADNGAVLATVETGDIRSGKYFVFNAVGHVKFRFTSHVYWASIVNAVFFDEAPKLEGAFGFTNVGNLSTVEGEVVANIILPNSNYSFGDVTLFVDGEQEAIGGDLIIQGLSGPSIKR